MLRTFTVARRVYSSLHRHLPSFRGLASTDKDGKQPAEPGTILGRRTRFQAGQCPGGRSPLGFLLRVTGRRGHGVAPDPALDVKHGIVIRPVPADMTVERRFEPLTLEGFLQVRLRVQGVHRFGGLGLDPWFDQIAGGLEAAVDEDGPDHGFDGIRQERRLLAAPRLFLAVAEAKRRAEIEFPGAPGQSLGADHMGPGPRQDAFGRRRITAEEPIRHDESQHGVAQELQSLVVLLQALFVGEGAVGEGLLE